MGTELVAGGGPALAFDGEGQGRLAWNGYADWLGGVGLAVAGREAPLTLGAPFAGEDDLGAYRGFAVSTPAAPAGLRLGVRTYAAHPLLVFRCEAGEELVGCATGDFERTVVAWPWLRPDRRREGGLPAGARGFGHLYTEFALPTWAGPDLADFFLLRDPPRPAVVEPLWIVAPDGSCVMLAPLNAFHDQVIAVPRGPERAGEGVRCGWHGDLERVPAGTASELAVFAGGGPRRVLETWGGILRRRAGTPPRSRYADPSLTHLSYWTDNGAAYWYRSEPGLDLPTTLERTLARLREERVPVRCVELDSWFYPHEKTRPLNPDGESDVPPTGAMAWEPRVDLLPEGVAALRRRLGEPPLVLHGRHFAAASPYWEGYGEGYGEGYAAWRDGDRAHPRDAAFFDALLEQAASWGAVQYEQDWLVESFLGVRGLRAEPGRARRWQEDLDRAAARRGLTTLWCMASPPDFMQTTSLRRVSAIRTSGDYRYRIGNRALWCWLLMGNAFARALDLPVFKDVFLSRRVEAGGAQSWDGDPYAEVEALLAVLCAGPVGLGDRLGHSDRTLALRTCREDGVLVKPDHPVAALERCYLSHPFFEAAPLLGETWSQHPAGRWVYLVALNAHRGEAPLRFALGLEELGEARPAGPVVLWDWRRRELRRLEPGARLEYDLAPGEWEYRVLCPVLPGGIAVVGDPERYATAGDRRLARVRAVPGGVAFHVLGAPGERVAVEGWSAEPVAPAEVRGGEPHERLPPAEGAWSWHREPGEGRWRLELVLGLRGRTEVRLAREPGEGGPARRELPRR